MKNFHGFSRLSAQLTKLDCFTKGEPYGLISEGWDYHFKGCCSSVYYAISRHRISWHLICFTDSTRMQRREMFGKTSKLHCLKVSSTVVWKEVSAKLEASARVECIRESA